MYPDMLEKYRKALPEFPEMRRPLVGAVVKETRVDKGIRQMDFAKQVGINWSTLKSIENDHQRATTVEMLEKCGKALGLTVQEMILLGREKDPANCLVFKKASPPEIKGVRERKRTPPDWRQSMRLQHKDFDWTPCSPPLRTKKDFFLARVNLPPKRKVENLKHAHHQEVFGFVSYGFNIKVILGEKETPLTGNQGFILDGFYSHSIVNDDEDQAAVIYLLSRMPNQNVIPARFKRESMDPRSKHSGMTKSPAGDLDIAQGIETLRRIKSERPGKELPVTHLADLTDFLDHEQIAKLLRIKKGSSVIYWEKIEDLLSGTGVSMEEFLGWCHRKEDPRISSATAATRAMIDLSAYQGVKIYSAHPSGRRSDFFFGELSIEGKEEAAKKIWERKDPSMIALFTEEGEFEIAVGRNRNPLTLLKGESIYFDGNLGYRIRNPVGAQARGFLAAYPAIQF